MPDRTKTRLVVEIDGEITEKIVPLPYPFGDSFWELPRNDPKVINCVLSILRSD
jgi:hypothetical protein